MKSFTLAVLAAVAVLCQADSFAVPNPWWIRNFKVWEPTPDESGIGGLWSFDIMDTAPLNPTPVGLHGFNTTCSYNFRYPAPESRPEDRETVFGCDDKSVHWSVGFRGGDCYSIKVAHNYTCLPQVIKPCVDDGAFDFCVADTLQETDQFFTAISHKGLIQIRPMVTFPRRDIRSNNEVTV